MEIVAGPYGPDKTERAIVATTDPQTLPDLSTWYLVTNLPAPSEHAGTQPLFPPASLEEVIRRKPDIILETLSPPLDPREAAQRKKDWERLGLVEDRIYIEGETYLLVPGPRFGLAAQRISEIVRGL